MRAQLLLTPPVPGEQQQPALRQPCAKQRWPAALAAVLHWGGSLGSPAMQMHKPKTDCPEPLL